MNKLVNQAREQARKLNESSPNILKLGSLASKQAREQARAYSFKIEPSRAYLILGSTRLGYTPTTDTYTGFIQIQNISKNKQIIGLYHNHIQSYTCSEVPVGTTGLILILQNLYLFYRYESTRGYYRTYTYFTDTRVPVGTIEHILILLIRE